MTEYWKSIPKKHCDVCNVWYQDNKSSVDFHEQGFRHKANVQKKLRDLRKRGSEQLEEQKKYNLEMMKIEAAALNSFQKDIASDSKLSKELSSTPSILRNLPIVDASSSSKASSSIYGAGRFGDQFVDGAGESLSLVRGREKALETISQKMVKKSKWLEAKTSEGKVYYWNKDSYETVWDKPKGGFLSIVEQQQQNISGPSTQPSGSKDFKHDPYGRWETVKNQEYEDDMPDLQLPPENIFNVEAESVPLECPVVVEKKPEMEFKERTIEIKSCKIKSEPVEFKKRDKSDKFKRNVRKRESSP